MKLSSFLGLVGGKPRFAYYFVGHIEKPAEDFSQENDQILGHQAAQYDQEFELLEPESDSSDRLIFLDPHYVNAQIDFNKADFAS